jgi:hypothetical protein
LETTESIVEYEKDLKKLLDFLQIKIKNLEKIKKTDSSKIKDQHQFDALLKDVISELDSIETEEKKLTSKIEKMNESLVKIRKDEETLYLVIKERYPNLSDDEIKNEIHRHLEK